MYQIERDKMVEGGTDVREDIVSDHGTERRSSRVIHE